MSSSPNLLKADCNEIITLVRLKDIIDAPLTHIQSARPPEIFSSLVLEFPTHETNGSKGVEICECHDGSPDVIRNGTPKSHRGSLWQNFHALIMQSPGVFSHWGYAALISAFFREAKENTHGSDGLTPMGSS